MPAPESSFVKVLLPLNLCWTPMYCLPEGMTVRRGDRVRVPFAGREYAGVVLGYDDTTPVNSEKILQVAEVLDIPPVSPEEFELWDFVSRYYLCSQGEVCRIASPSAALERPPLATIEKLAQNNWTDIRKPHLSATLKQSVQAILEAFDQGINVLLCAGSSRRQIFQELSRRTLESGRDVLILRPSVDGPVLDGSLCYASSLSQAQKRNAVHLVRTAGPLLVEGESPAVFLPFGNLGLVIVDDEFSQDYKQSFRPPFYNARDVAYMLAKIRKAPLLLCAEYPSLESLYNCSAGRLKRIDIDDSPSTGKLEIIDIAREKLKNGMAGSFSRIALARMESTLGENGRVLLLQPWKDTSDIEIEARKNFPSAGSKINSMPLWKADRKELSKYSLVLLSNVDYLLSKQDFRADEYAFRQIERLRHQCPNLLIQTSESGHYIFSGGNALEKMLSQRREFSLPPFTREVRIRNGEASESHFLAKDAALEKRKLELLKNAPRGAVIDVDPSGL